MGLLGQEGRRPGSAPPVLGQAWAALPRFHRGRVGTQSPGTKPERLEGKSPSLGASSRLGPAGGRGASSSEVILEAVCPQPGQRGGRRPPTLSDSGFCVGHWAGGTHVPRDRDRMGTEVQSQQRELPGGARAWPGTARRTQIQGGHTARYLEAGDREEMCRDRSGASGGHARDREGGPGVVAVWEAVERRPVRRAG